MPIARGVGERLSLNNPRLSPIHIDSGMQRMVRVDPRLPRASNRASRAGWKRDQWLRALNHPNHASRG